MNRKKKVLRNDAYICDHVKTKFISYKLLTHVCTVYKTFIVAASNSREQLFCGESKLKTRQWILVWFPPPSRAFPTRKGVGTSRLFAAKPSRILRLCAQTWLVSTPSIVIAQPIRTICFIAGYQSEVSFFCFVLFCFCFVCLPLQPFRATILGPSWTFGILTTPPLLLLLSPCFFPFLRCTDLTVLLQLDGKVFWPRFLYQIVCFNWQGLAEWDIGRDSERICKYFTSLFPTSSIFLCVCVCVCVTLGCAAVLYCVVLHCILTLFRTI